MIEGQHARLVPLERRHLEATRAWSNDPALAILLDRAWPVSEFEHERWVETLKQRDRLYFGIERHDGLHVGNVWLWDIDWRHRKAELRIVIGRDDATGRGIGSEVIDLLVRHAFERLNLHRVYAYVLAINPRARTAFEKAGFVVEGTLKADRWIGDQFTDVFVLGRVR